MVLSKFNIRKICYWCSYLYSYRKTYLMLLFVIASCSIACAQNHGSIDRYALVHRHNVKITAFDSLNSLSVGNGKFAFTVDATGLQTFPEYYENGVPLGTQSQWGWHSFPNPDNYRLDDVMKKFKNGEGRYVSYPVRPDKGRAGKAAHWLRSNPHRLQLGQVGLVLLNENGTQVEVKDIKNIHQELDLWTGNIESYYTIEGEPVHVELYSHQDLDQISAHISSPLIGQQRLKVKFRFSYGSDCHVCPGYDYSRPKQHETLVIEERNNEVLLQRNLDSTTYFVDIKWEGEAELKKVRSHTYRLVPAPEQDTFSFNVLFTDKKPTVDPASFEVTQQNSRKEWRKFWTTGGAVDFSGSTDPRAFELERRIILSQYLTKIQASGSLPPQETGLTMNSWYGKFHLEMHWWHGVHFALWNHINLLGNSISWYKKILPQAQATAQRQGYEGARWPKMTGPAGRESPSGVGPFIIWQQPHIVYFAELFYRQNPTRETLLRFKELVFETADFMASFVTYNEEDGSYHLTPPLIPAQELFDKKKATDPAFGLAYWHYALSIAQKWRKRLGLEPNKKWQDVLDHLAPLPVKNGFYLPTANAQEAYTNDKFRHDHPIITGVYGILPSKDLIDEEIMRNTYNEVLSHWDWESTWGWDYPMMAMAAARLGMPKKAVDALMMDVRKNTYLKNGHNYQGKRLRIYLPGNGGFLTAVAMMVAGWDGAERKTPGFPDNGRWKIEWEGLKKMP